MGQALRVLDGVSIEGSDDAIVRTLNAKELVEWARFDESLEWSGLDKWLERRNLIN